MQTAAPGSSAVKHTCAVGRCIDFILFFIFLQKALLEHHIWEACGFFPALASLTRCKRKEKNHPHFPSVGREKTREIHATCMQLEEEENPSEPCALPGDAFTVSLQSACPGVQPAFPRAPGDRSASAAASAPAAAAGSGRGTRAEGERERTARERGEGRKRVITQGRRGPASLRTAPVWTRLPAGPVLALPRPSWVSARGRCWRVRGGRRRAGRAVAGRGARGVTPAPQNWTAAV